MASSSGRVARSSCRYCSIWVCIIAQVLLVLALLVWLWLSADLNCCSFSGNIQDSHYITAVNEWCHERNKSKDWNASFFTLYVTIFVLKSFSFQLLLSLVRSDFHLYFVSVLLKISVSLFVSVNEIISFSVSISVNEYITASNRPECVYCMSQVAYSHGHKFRSLIEGLTGTFRFFRTRLKSALYGRAFLQWPMTATPAILYCYWMT